MRLLCLLTLPLALLLAPLASAKSAPLSRVRVPDPFKIRTTLNPETQSDEGEARWQLRCDDTHWIAVQTHVSILPATGSGIWRSAEQNVTLQGPGKQPSRQLLSRERYEDWDELPAFELECQGRTVHLMVGEISLGIEAQNDSGNTLALDPSLPGKLKQWLSEPARGQLAEARELRALLRLLDDRADAETQAMAELLVRREAFAAGDWRGLGIEPPLKGEDTLSPELKERFQRFEREVKEAREHSQPLRAGEPRQLGRLAPSEFVNNDDIPPVDNAVLFWRKQALCVRQADAKDVVRCYDTTTGKWGQREPLTHPEFSGTLVREASRGARCDGYGICEGRNERFAGVTRDGYLVLGPRGWVERRQRNESRRLSPEALRTELSRGPGSAVLRDGQYLLHPGGYFTPSDAKDLRSWFLLDAPPPEPEHGEWIRFLVSPDQQWVAFTSGVFQETTKPTLLWLARIVPGPGAPPASPEEESRK